MLDVRKNNNNNNNNNIYNHSKDDLSSNSGLKVQTFCWFVLFSGS